MPSQTTPAAPAPRPAADRPKAPRPKPRKAPTVNQLLDQASKGVRPPPQTDKRPSAREGARFERQFDMLRSLQQAHPGSELVVQPNGDLALSILTECVGPEECEVFMYVIPWRENYTLAPGYRGRIFPPRLEGLDPGGNTGVELREIFRRFGPEALADRWLAWDDPAYAHCEDSGSSTSSSEEADSEDLQFVSGAANPEPQPASQSSEEPGETPETSSGEDSEVPLEPDSDEEDEPETETTGELEESD